MFATLAFKLCLLFIVIIVGYAAYKIKVLDDHTVSHITNYLMTFAVPAILITAVGTEPISDGNINLLYCGIVMACYYLFGFGGVLLFGKLRGFSRAKRAVTTCMSVIPNVAFIGLPLTQQIVGDDAVPYIGIMMTAFNIVFFTIGMRMFDERGEGKIDWKKTLLTPCNVCTVIMIVLLACNIQLEEHVYTILSQISSMVTPLALLVIGANVAKIKLSSIVTRGELWILSAMKLIVFPMVVFLLLMLFDLPDKMCMALLIGIGCPGSALAAVIANQNHMEPELASQSVAHSTFFCIVSLPLLIVLGMRMLGITAL